MFEISESWKRAFPQAHAGVLVVRGASNPLRDDGLERRKTELEADLRSRFSALDRAALLRLPPLQAYDEYYRRFNKTYHIQLQLESIVFKGKSIPGVAALVEAMFMAEMDDLLLTAGHDLDVLRLPLTLDTAKGGEIYTLMRGEEQALKAGDMFIRDGDGVISSVIYGPDRRTQIRPETKDAVFTTYAPAGIGESTVKLHLEHIWRNIRLFAPNAAVQTMQVLPSG